MIHLIIIILIVCYYYFTKKKETFYEGSCVFDIDNTITLGVERARDIIGWCKKNNYKIAINTARPIKFYLDLDLKGLGLVEKDFIDDFYIVNRLLYTVPEGKVENLKHISRKYNLEPGNIIFFDDLLENIEGARKHGFSTIHANDNGIPSNFSLVKSLS